MAIHYGEDFELHVRTATGPDVWTPVEDLNRFGSRTSRNQNSYAAFRRATSYTIPGPREKTFTVSGYLNNTDTGQNYLRTNEVAGTTVRIRVLPSGGANGYDQDVRVGSTTHDATPEGIQEISFEFTAVGDPIIAGTGPIL